MAKGIRDQLGDRERLERQIDTMKGRRAGFVVVDDMAIWGFGDTKEAAWADARSNAESIDDSFLAFPATAALLAEVRERGGNIASALVGGTACTTAEGDDW